MESSINSKSKLSVGFFFLSLGALISLITSVVSFLNLVFETLNKQFPDILNSSYQYGYYLYEYESLRMSLATLIIFFPVFLVISRFWKKFQERELGSGDELVRKWLIYLVLFLSSLVTIIDLVALVRYFVSGEITTRFILKVAVVLVVALSVGGYYVFELTGRKKILSMPIGIWSSVKASIFVVLAIVWSFSVIGSPMKQRELRLDDRRVADLQNIQYQVINYWQQKEKLPESLEALVNPLTGYSLPVPPEFEKGETYEYQAKNKMTFELCATFALAMPKGWREHDQGGVYPVPFARDRAGVVYPYPGYGANESWDHEAGRACFERTIDPDIYPPFPKQ